MIVLILVNCVKDLYFVQLVSPGAWLSDLCQERYEVREKKTSKKVAMQAGIVVIFSPSYILLF